MTDDRLRQEQPEDLDRALEALVGAQSVGRPDGELLDRIVSAATVIPQRRRPRWFAARWVSWPTSHAPRLLGVAVGGLAVVLLVVLVSGPLLGSGLPSPAPGTIASANPTAGATETPTSAPQQVGGTCPVTPITRVGGGLAPEIDVSGLRWRAGYVPWVAGVPEKVVWLADQGIESKAGVTVFAGWIDAPILVGSQPITYSNVAPGSVYVDAVDTGWVDDLVLPVPGCWLLTASWSGGASSIVVAARSPSGVASSALPVTGQVGTTALTVCPATPVSPDAPPTGWPGPAVVDGPFRWLLPPNATWRFGGDGDKLVLDSTVGWSLHEMRVLAVPLAHPDSVGWLAFGSVAGDVPSGFGGGTLGLGLTLPGRGCWAFVFVDPAATSTIVDDLTLSEPAGFIPPSGGIDASIAIQIASGYDRGTLLAGARSGPLSSLGIPVPPFLSPERAVWGIEFSGGAGVICPPAPGASCTPISAGRSIVVLDYQTGAFLFSTLESYSVTTPSP
jgi:hypothetical protein